MTGRGLTRRAMVGLLGGSVASLAGCLDGVVPPNGPSVSDTSTPAAPRNVPSDDPDTYLGVTAAKGRAHPSPTLSTEMFLYGDQYPAPTLRVEEESSVRATVVNRLPAPTTVHWHGLPVPNWVDGVPNLTQGPIPPGDSERYDFVASPAGTYLYHSHVGLQLDWTLGGVLVVEESSPHVDYDREYVVFLDDLLTHHPPRTAFPNVPTYEGLTMNGSLPGDPPTFEVNEGERVRLRIVNAAAATTFRVHIAGHALSVTHKDGRPVDPTTVDALDVSMGERYDAVVTAATPGSWEVVAGPVNGDDVGNPPPAVGVLTYGQTSGDERRSPETPTTTLDYSMLHSTESYDGVGGTPDRRYRLRLSRGSKPGSWAIDDQLYPDAEWLDVRPNEHVRFVMRNESDMVHPMHLHGHFFVTDGVIMDTVMVRPGEERVLDFYTDNPGRWFFHCHNDYHLASGMARVVSYLPD